jgi:GT2 family glycosyltransferase
MKVVILIVTFNGEKYITRLLNSIAQFEPEIDIIIVDNNSNDHSLKNIHNFNNLHLIKLKDNLGFGQANNVGINYALKNKYDFIFLLNQDTFLVEPVIDGLIAKFNSSSDIGIISPIQMGINSKIESSFNKFLCQQNIYSSIFSDLIYGNKSSDLYKVDFVQAAAWFVPASTFNIIGGFDPIFYHYGEDNNYVQRLKYFKLNIYICLDYKIIHDSNSSNEFYIKDYKSYHFNRLKSLFFNRFCDVNRSYNLNDIFILIKNELFKLFKVLVRFNLFKSFRILKYILFIILSLRKVSYIRQVSVKPGPNFL